MKTNIVVNKRHILLTLLLLVSIIALAAPKEKEKKVALIWGNSEYINGWKTLDQCVHDADTMASIFKSFGYDVLLLKDGNRAKMANSFNEFCKILKSADVAVFYYSGHATYVNGSYYLIPIDANLRDDPLINEFFPVEDIKNELIRRVGLSFLFFDACRNGTITKETETGTKKGYVTPPERKNTDSSKPSGCVSCFATEVGTETSAISARLSTFTKFLAEYISYRENFNELWGTIESKVAVKTNGKQTPVIEGVYTKEFMFNPKGTKKLEHKDSSKKIKYVTIIATNADYATISINIDGKQNKYTADDVIDLEVGKTYYYTIEANGYHAYANILEVTDDTPYRIEIELEEKRPATLELRDCTPGAAVFLDSVYRGDTPLRIDSYKGPHQLRLSKKGYVDYNLALILAEGRNQERIKLSKKIPWIFDFDREHDRMPGMCFTFSPQNQIGFEYFNIYKKSHFSIGFYLAASLDQLKSHFNKKIEYSKVVSPPELVWLEDDKGFMTPYNQIVTTISGCPDEYSEEIDPNHEVEQKEKSFMLMLNGGYLPSNGVMLQAGVGLAGIASILYMPCNYTITKKVYADRINGNILENPKPEMTAVRNDGGHWYKDGKYELSPATRLGLKVLLPFGSTSRLIIGAGYSYIILNNKYSSWDASLGFTL